MIIERGLSYINLKMGESGAMVNGSEYKYFDTKAVLTPLGRTMVPLRFISEVLGATVDWVEKDWAVYISDPEAPSGGNGGGGSGGSGAAVDLKESGWQAYQKVKPYVGKPFPLDKFKIDPVYMRDPVPWINEKPKIMEVTVDDLKPNGIAIGEDTDRDSYAAVSDLWVLWVTEEAIYVKQTKSAYNPDPLDMLLVENGNEVNRWIGSMGYQKSNPFTYAYPLNRVRGESGIETAKLEDIVGFMFLWGIV